MTYVKITDKDGKPIDLSNPLPVTGDGSSPVPVQVMGSLPSKVEISTIVNAQSVAAGANTGDVSLGVTTESEVWLLVTIDQQPWNLSTNSPWRTTADGAGVFPARTNVTQTFSINNPATSLFLGMAVNTTNGLTIPTSMTEARQYFIPPNAQAACRVTNSSGATATVTVRVIRVWRA